MASPEEIADHAIRYGTYGCVEDTTQIFVSVNTADYVYGPVPLKRSIVGDLFPNAQHVMLLEMIWIPDNMRKQGWATRIIHRLRQRASSEDMWFSVGAVTDETGAIERILEKYR